VVDVIAQDERPHEIADMVFLVDQRRSGGGLLDDAAQQGQLVVLDLDIERLSCDAGEVGAED